MSLFREHSGRTNDMSYGHNIIRYDAAEVENGLKRRFEDKLT